MCVCVCERVCLCMYHVCVVGESVALSKDNSLSKAKVKHDPAWSSSGWVTVMCYVP